MRKIAKHIAQVVINLPITLQELTTIKQLAQIKPLKYALSSGIIDDQIKKTFLDRVAARLNLSTPAKHLLLYLVKHRLTAIIDNVIEYYIKLLDKKNNILRVKVYSATELTQKQLSNLKEKLQNMGNFKEVILEVEIKKELLGGLRLKVGDKVIDGTLQGHLERLSKHLGGVHYGYS